MKTHTLFFTPPSLSIHQIPFSHTQIQFSIKCARNKKTRSSSVRSTALILKSAYLIASKLRVIPKPLDFAIREFAGGSGSGGSNGGGFGFGKDFGWGGSRRNKRKLGFLWVLVGACGLGLCLILGKEIDGDVVRAVLGFSLFGVSVSGWKIRFKDWILGFCCCAFLVGLELNEGFENEMKMNRFGEIKKSLFGENEMKMKIVEEIEILKSKFPSKLKKNNNKKIKNLFGSDLDSFCPLVHATSAVLTLLTETMDGRFKWGNW